jgi:hypothetical protein
VLREIGREQVELSGSIGAFMPAKLQPLRRFRYPPIDIGRPEIF